MLLELWIKVNKVLINMENKIIWVLLGLDVVFIICLMVLIGVKKLILGVEVNRMRVLVYSIVSNNVKIIFFF